MASAASALDSYWNDISVGDYSAAYAYLAPGAVQLTSAQFVTDEQKVGISGIQFDAGPVAISGSSATVTVGKLVTTDSEYGCRSWSGSYTMIDASGTWLIGRSNITPHACTG